MMVPSILAIRWVCSDLTVILISLMKTDAEYLYTFISHLDIFSYEMSLQLFCPYFVFDFLIVIFWFLKIWMSSLLAMCIMNTLFGACYNYDRREGKECLWVHMYTGELNSHSSIGGNSTTFKENQAKHHLFSLIFFCLFLFR